MDDTIVATEIQETEFGEKVYIDSPFVAKQYIKYAPWDNGDDVNPEELDEDTDLPDFDFSSGFGTHSKWDPQAEQWNVDLDTFAELSEFLETVGFTVEVGEDVPDGVLE